MIKCHQPHAAKIHTPAPENPEGKMGNKSTKMGHSGHEVGPKRAKNGQKMCQLGHFCGLKLGQKN